MDSYEILEREAVMNAYVRESGERISLLETCLDDLSSKLARICQSDLTDQRVMRGLLDQTRMVTLTIRGYDKLIEMRMNMQAHQQASQRHIQKLRAEQREQEQKDRSSEPLAAEMTAKPTLKAEPEQEKNILHHQPTANSAPVVISALKNKKNTLTSRRRWSQRSSKSKRKLTRVMEISRVNTNH